MKPSKADHIGLKMKTYNFVKLLGSGAWSTVYEVYDEKTRGPAACKIIPKKSMEQTPKLKQLVHTEITVLQRCFNENVIRYIDSFSNDKNVYIFTEFCNGGDMQQYLKEKKYLPEEEAREFLKQILNGFKGLHEVGAMHRDFKAANVLLHNGIAKIADLGFAKILKNKTMTITILGTSVTMAPELLENKSYGNQCDIWSVGVVYFQMLTGDYPYNAINDQEILKRIKSGPPKFLQKFQISDESKDFVFRCLTVDPKKRISWKELYEHPILSQKYNKIRQTTVGTLMSKINLNKNKQFYQTQKDINPMSMENNSNQNYQFPTAVLEQSKDLQKIQQEIEKRRVVQATLIKYSQQYLQKRNRIMLILKYGISPIFQLQPLPFNQNIYAFLMCKKAFLDISEFRKAVKNRTNIFKLVAYLAEFGASQQYVRIQEQVNSDFQLITAYANSFILEVQTNNPRLKAQLTLESVTAEFNQLFKQELNTYCYRLFDQRNNPKVRRQSVIKLLTFIYDLLIGITIYSEAYDRRMETLDLNQVQKQFTKRIQQAQQAQQNQQNK